VGGNPLNGALDGLWDWGWGGQRRVGGQHLVTVGIGDVFDGHVLAFGRGPRLASLNNPLIPVKATLLLEFHRVVELECGLEAVHVHLCVVAEDIGIFVGGSEGQQAGESNLQGVQGTNQLESIEDRFNDKATYEELHVVC